MYSKMSAYRLSLRRGRSLEEMKAAAVHSGAYMYYLQVM